MAGSSPPLTLEAIMGAMKTLLAPLSERLQRLEEAVFSDKASEAGSTSTFTGFSAHSLKSGESRQPPGDAGKWQRVSSVANERKYGFTKARSVSDQIRIQPTTVADFRSFTKFMDEEKIPYHTFTLPEEKNTRVVLRGIPVQVSMEAVLQDLKLQGFNPVCVHRMHAGKRQLPPSAA
ncbi:hypothetical protein TcasGA2_TC031008 [Tribolium castaneum]|uniref:Nucleic-acid-binding protein from transposon X-element-like Protein n=1 Tax=Tribolium castaneum TaxID=7070 RepID=A0A139W9Y2_TRICA|nr:hypothetical protein TcasGA2_TC031008 [Tribolium castaneum]